MEYENNFKLFIMATTSSNICFCNVCDNMYYIQIDDENRLCYYCRHCGNVNNTITVENVVISKSYTTSTTGKDFKSVLNKYTKYDNTLPRITDGSIKCPNAECATNKENKLFEVICIRYDPINIKYGYLCAVCDSAWENK